MASSAPRNVAAVLASGDITPDRAYCSSAVWVGTRMSNPARRMAAAGLLSAVVALAGCGSGAVVPSSRTAPAESPTALTPVPNAPHVMVIMEENKGYAATLGSCSDDPYWCSLASAYGSATSWFATDHPSLPNYLAIDSGSTQGCSSDRCAGGYSAQDVGGQLSAAGIPWTAYMESMPSSCYNGSTAGEYARKHNPFAYFTDNNGACHIRPYPGATGLLAALRSTSAPAFVWISPNVADDMHDGSVQRGDAWLRENLAGVLSSSWFANSGTIIITMDENDANSSSPGGGRIPMVVLSTKSKGAGGLAQRGNHYGTLRSIEEVFGLAFLGGARDSTNGDLASIFG